MCSFTFTFSDLNLEEEGTAGPSLPYMVGIIIFILPFVDFVELKHEFLLTFGSDHDVSQHKYEPHAHSFCSSALLSLSKAYF